MSKRKQNSLSPWDTFDDIIYIRDCFYGSEPRFDEGIAKIKAFSTKGPLPHPVEATSLLFSALNSVNSHADLDVVRLSLSMALVRLVNGYVDRNKDGKSSKAVYHVAQKLGIPSHFVELRHSATHEALPSLDMLQICAHDALNWLWKNYWGPLKESDFVDTRAQSVDKSTNISEYKKKQENIQFKIKQEFKSWRRLRKNDTNGVVDLEQKNSHELLDVVTRMRYYAQEYEEETMDVIIYKNIMVSKSTVPVNRIAELYGPLLNHLSNPSFISKLVENILNLISMTENDNSLDLLRSNPAISIDKKEENEYMCNSLKYWVQYFFKERSTPSLENPWFDDISQEIVYLIQYPQPWFFDVFRAYLDNPEAPSNEHLTLLMDHAVKLFNSSKSQDFEITELETLENQLGDFKQRLDLELRKTKEIHPLKKSKDDQNLNSRLWILQESYLP